MPILRMLKNTLAFLTVIPVGMDERVFNDAARLMWTFPLYGALIGFIAGCVGLTLHLTGIPLLAVAAITYASILSLTGFNHMDGLLDFADAIAAPVSREKRLQIMKDQYTGAAAMTTSLTLAIATIAFISAVPSSSIIHVLIVSEASAKLGMVVSAFMGPAARKGLGEIFVMKFREGRRYAKLAASIMLCLTTSLLMLGMAGVTSCLASVLTGIIVTEAARRSFGGITGDVLGAINEISRATSLAVCVVSLN